MKKILYIAPMDDINSINGGYSKVAKEFKRIFELIHDDKAIIHFCPLIEFYKINQTIEAGYDKVIFLMHPSQVVIDSDRIKLAIKKIPQRYLHIFWETETFPEKWDVLFKGDLFTGFIASSFFNKIHIEKMTKKPVHYLPVAINEKDYENYKIDPEFKNSTENIFRVLYVGQYTKRKGLEDSVIAFIHALGDKEDCELVLKYYNASPYEIPIEQLVHYLANTNIKKYNLKAKVLSLQEDMDQDKLFTLYKESSLLIFPSRGEGFGLPVVESFMLGLPCIYSDNSALSELRQVGGNPIHCYEELAYGMTQYDYTGMYKVPYIEDMVNKLKHLYSLWERDKKNYYEISQNEYKKTIELFGTEKVTTLFKEFIHGK